MTKQKTYTETELNALCSFAFIFGGFTFSLAAVLALHFTA
jgi:hypothetical protein